MVQLQRRQLIISAPAVHPAAACRIGFQRTLRIPDNNRDYPLPAGLGRFPMAAVGQHSARVPQHWNERGGVLLPMYQAEAMWIEFEQGQAFRSAYPFAIKIAAGKINAITGEPWRDGLSDQPQDYVVTPGQPWLDGFCVQKGLIRQFVAMPLGQGYTAEEQITDTAQHGGLQIVAYPMKRERYERKRRETEDAEQALHEELARQQEQGKVAHVRDLCYRLDPEMGLAPGGLMRQEIHADEHGIDAWDQTKPSRCFVHILNSQQWETVTGQPAPDMPPNAADYRDAHLPWFEYYDERQQSLDGGKPLAQLDSVAALAVKKGHKPLPDNDPIQPADIVPLGAHGQTVEDGRW